MNLDVVYEQWRQRTLQEGRQEGKQEALQEEIADLLEVRFGGLDSDLAAIATKIVQLPKRDRTQLLLQLPTLSREELIAQIEQHDPD